MIDKETGDIVFETGRLDHAMSREDFLVSPLGAEAEVTIENAEHRTYRVHVANAVGERFVLRPYFNGPRLETVDVCVSEERFGSSWDDWSEQKEYDRKNWHDRWLEDICEIIPGQEFAWGGVVSEFDKRSGGTSIRISYKPGIRC